MKNTALTHKHIQLGAKMVPFAGYSMPVQYEGVTLEHETVRNGVGVFDVSHMGEFILRGPNALEFLQKFSSNDASKLFDGKAQYSCMPNGKGGIVDDLIIYRISEHEYFLVVNASNIEKDWNWISSLNEMNVEMTDVSDDYTLLAIQGPKAAASMQALTKVNLSEMNYYTFEYSEFAGIKDVMISATGYTGSGGFEIYVKNEDAEELPNTCQSIIIRSSGSPTLTNLRSNSSLSKITSNRWVSPKHPLSDISTTYILPLV